MSASLLNLRQPQITTGLPMETCVCAGAAGSAGCGTGASLGSCGGATGFPPSTTHWRGRPPPPLVPPASAQTTGKPKNRAYEFLIVIALGLENGASSTCNLTTSAVVLYRVVAADSQEAERKIKERHAGQGIASLEQVSKRRRAHSFCICIGGFVHRSKRCRTV